MKEKLKPCPFCGSEDVWVAEKRVYDGLKSSSVFQVTCGDCYVRTGYTTEESATDDWNRRVSDE